MAYYKDSPYAQQTLFPRMVNSVRTPLLPDGYQGNDIGYYDASNNDQLKKFFLNPWVIGTIIIIIALIIWFAMK